MIIENDKMLLFAEGYSALESGEGRKIRQKAKLSLEEAGERVGVVKSAVSLWERRERQPTIDHVIAYGRLLRTLRESGDEEDK